MDDKDKKIVKFEPKEKREARKKHKRAFDRLLEQAKKLGW